MAQSPVTTCSFAHEGTYGHECGKPATLVAVIQCEPGSYGMTKTGVYFGGRCADHAHTKGRDNARCIRVEPLNGHVNEW